MEPITNFVRISSNDKITVHPDKDFFRAWVDFLRPLHELAPKEMEGLAAILKKRYELSKVIIDADLLDKTLMSPRTKLEIRQSVGISQKHFQMIIGKLRRRKVLIHNEFTKEDKLAPNFIPQMSKDGVGLLIYFDFTNEQPTKLDSI
jgi:hypothetical protein